MKKAKVVSVNAETQTAGLVEVPKPIVEVVKPESDWAVLHRDKVHSLAREIMVAAANTGLRTMDLCRYIREQKLEKDLVRKELLDSGLHKAFVSEVLRVSQVAPELWKEYAAGAIGFKKILQLSRATTQHLLAEVSGASNAEIEEGLQEAGLTDVVVVGGNEVGRVGGGADVTSDGISKKMNSMAAAGKTILLCAEYLEKHGKRPKQIGQKWTLGQGWVLTLTKEKSGRAATKES